jgi:hypothetical protein
MPRAPDATLSVLAAVIEHPSSAARPAPSPFSLTKITLAASRAARIAARLLVIGARFPVSTFSDRRNSGPRCDRELRLRPVQRGASRAGLGYWGSPPRRRSAQPRRWSPDKAAVDPIFGLIAEHKRLVEERLRIYAELDTAEAKWRRAHEARPSPYIAWRSHRAIDAEDVDDVREEFLGQPRHRRRANRERIPGRKGEAVSGARAAIE